MNLFMREFLEEEKIGVDMRMRACEVSIRVSARFFKNLPQNNCFDVCDDNIYYTLSSGRIHYCILPNSYSLLSFAKLVSRIRTYTLFDTAMYVCICYVSVCEIGQFVTWAPYVAACGQSHWIVCVCA